MPINKETKPNQTKLNQTNYSGRLVVGQEIFDQVLWNAFAILYIHPSVKTDSRPFLWFLSHWRRCLEYTDCFRCRKVRYRSRNNCLQYVTKLNLIVIPVLKIRTAITPRFSQTRCVNTCWGPIYGLNRGLKNNSYSIGSWAKKKKKKRKYLKTDSLISWHTVKINQLINQSIN